LPLGCDAKLNNQHMRISFIIASDVVRDATFPNIRTVSPEERIWRIRMKHNTEQTQKLITAWPR
jgi:hypothetical protein